MRPINKTSIRSAVLVLILAGVIIEFGRSAFGKFCVVDGYSMSPTLNPDDVVQAKASYVKVRGDVVIVTDDGGDLAIKRIVGLPGEVVTIYRGHVYVNGQRLLEPYLAGGTFTFKSNPRNQRAEVWHLDADQYFVLGDNRYESRDSRHYGPLQRSDVHGVVHLPENSPEPGFLEIKLSESGQVTHYKHYRSNHHASWNRNLTRNNSQNSNARAITAGFVSSDDFRN